MRLIEIKPEEYNDCRINLMLDCYKWDPQFEDHNTVCRFALVLTQQEHQQLIRLTEQIDRETINSEEAILKSLKLIKPLRLPNHIQKELKRINNYNPQDHVRLMRYDFHPTAEGWAVSEVNSDVPGGFAEASFMPREVLKHIDEKNLTYFDFSREMIQALKKKIKPGGTIMMVHCTSFSDDRQVMQFLGDRLKEEGFRVLYGSADHVRFKGDKAFSILNKHEGPLDGIFRFTPVEWFCQIRPKNWGGFFTTTTCSCNHPMAILVQSKRFPFIWSKLEKMGISLSAWRSLLPDTIPTLKGFMKKDYILKPACGRVGENISIKEACSKTEYRSIRLRALLSPQKFIAQKRFISKPLTAPDGKQYHLCLGVYSVEGKFAGYYARLSNLPRIDSNAMDLAVLIEGENDHE